MGQASGSGDAREPEPPGGGQDAEQEHPAEGPWWAQERLGGRGWEQGRGKREKGLQRPGWEGRWKQDGKRWDAGWWSGGAARGRRAPIRGRIRGTHR